MVNRKQNLQQRRRGAGRKLEDRAPMLRAAQRSRAVEIAISALHQSGNRISALAGRAAKRVKHCEISQRTDLEDGAQILRSAADGCAVEISITASHELRSWISALVRRTAKRVKRYYDSQSGAEDCAFGVRSTQCSGTVKAPAAALHQPAEWNSTIAKHTSKRVHDRDRAGWCDAKQRSLIKHAAQRC